MIYVCDAVMGAGKTSASIRYINEHLDRKFIYITPYLDEATRIRDGCPQARFVEPSDKLKRYHFRKLEHTAALIEEGRNITTTHQAFKGYTAATLLNIKKHGYTLLIDENVDVLENYQIHPDDLQIAVDSGYIKEEDNVYRIGDKPYHGKAFSDLFYLLRSRELLKVEDDKKGESLFYWILPPELITAFKDVIVMTYMFDGQSLHHFFEIYGLKYKYIGIDRTEDWGYRFGKSPGYTPEYISHIKDRLIVLDNDKLNQIGDEYHALSMNWFKRDGEGVEQLRKNIANFFINIFGDIPSDRRLWGSYNDSVNKIKGKGYTKSFLTFNAKATNAYKTKDCLVYVPNIFMNVNEKRFYESHGITVDEDAYALSIMIQWIWRSAIRDGGTVNLYIPSKRMRTLLINWMDEVSKEVSANE